MFQPLPGSRHSKLKRSWLCLQFGVKCLWLVTFSLFLRPFLSLGRRGVRVSQFPVQSRRQSDHGTVRYKNVFQCMVYNIIILYMYSMTVAFYRPSRAFVYPRCWWSYRHSRHIRMGELCSIWTFLRRHLKDGIWTTTVPNLFQSAEIQVLVGGIFPLAPKLPASTWISARL